jgi:membrane-bound lytic murein transglycosylase B
MQKFVLKLGVLWLLSFSVLANYGEREDVQMFIDTMVSNHGYDRDVLEEWMEGVQQQTTALESIAKPAEAKPWKDYRPIFLTERRVREGVEFWKQNAQILERAQAEFGVPPEIVVGILGVETFYGKRAGSYPILDALTTLGFDYPPRGEFFRKQLEQYLLMVREENIDPRGLKGSYAGAMGMPQFIPGSFRKFAVDFDGDGKRDLWNSTADAVGSVANYFHLHGWKSGEPIVSRAAVNGQALTLDGVKMQPHKVVSEFKQMGVTPIHAFADNAMATLLQYDGSNGMEYWLGLDNFYVITRYNHSPLYALAVYQLGQAVALEYRAGNEN